jgi:hypothetical protein
MLTKRINNDSIRFARCVFRVEVAALHDRYLHRTKIPRRNNVRDRYRFLTRFRLRLTVHAKGTDVQASPVQRRVLIYRCIRDARYLLNFP